MSDTIARALLTIGAVGFAPDAPLRFKSGILSPVYVDNRRLPYHPEAWRMVIEGFQALIEREQLAPDVIAGVAVGGVPHSAALAYASRKPSVFVRKAPKDHGKGQRVEGGDVNGKQVLLVEDLVTTGGSSLSGVAALREGGATVTTVISIVSYGFAEAARQFSAADVRLHELITFDTILAVALAGGVFSEDDHAIIRDWFDDPHGWANRHSHT